MNNRELYCQLLTTQFPIICNNCN